MDFLAWAWLRTLLYYQVVDKKKKRNSSGIPLSFQEWHEALVWLCLLPSRTLSTIPSVCFLGLGYMTIF